MIDPNNDIVPTLRMFDGLMMNIAADEIETLRARVKDLEARAAASAQPAGEDAENGAIGEREADEPTTVYNPVYVREKFSDYQRQIDGLTEELAFARAALPAEKVAHVEAGENLPCPICKGVEGCDHTGLERARASAVGLDDERAAFEKIAASIHYPACWDTAAYPTLASALVECADWYDMRCGECLDGSIARAALTAEKVAAEPAYSWLPISSAPRDGSNILIRFGRDGVSQAKYVPGVPHPWKFIDTNDGITWLINGARDDEYGPSHWMPMPSPCGPEPGDVIAAQPANGGKS